MSDRDLTKDIAILVIFTMLGALTANSPVKGLCIGIIILAVKIVLG
jgi:hypothetical protein